MKNSLHETVFLSAPECERIFPTTYLRTSVCMYSTVCNMYSIVWCGILLSCMQYVQYVHITYM